MVSVAQRQDPWLFIEKRAEEETTARAKEHANSENTSMLYSHWKTGRRDRERRFLSTGLSQKSRAGKHMAARIMT